MPKMTKEHQKATWLSVSESEAEDTNVIARPLVPNLPARPTCGKFSTNICLNLFRNPDTDKTKYICNVRLGRIPYADKCRQNLACHS